MSFQVIPVPAFGAEDVVVGTHGPDEGAVFTGTEDGSILRVSPRRAPVDRVAQHRRPPARHRDRPRRAAAGLRRPPAACSASTPAPARSRRVTDSVAGAGWCSATTPRSPRTGRSGSPTPRRSTASSGGRTTSSRTPAPAGCCGCDPDGDDRGGPRRAAPSPTGWRCRRDEDFVAVAESGARTVVRRWLTGDRGRAARPPVPGPARLPRQHRPRQRRPDLGDHRQPHRRARRAAAAVARCWLRQAVTRIPETAAAQAEADRAGAGVRRRRARSCTTSTCARRARRGVPHGHRRPRARRPGLDGQPARAGGRVSISSDPTRHRRLARHGSLLESITGPARPARPHRRPAGDRWRARSATSWSRRAHRGGHLGPNLGVVELTLAIHRVFDSPRDRVVFDTGHQAYVHKMLTGRAGAVRPAAPGGRPQRLPEPGRVRPRHRRELPRLDRAVLRRRAGQGLRDPRRGPARRRGDRRRRADRRHGLGGAEQHRDRQATPGWSSSSTTTAAPTRRPSAGSPTALTTLRTNPRYEQVLDLVKKRLNAVPGVGPRGVRRAARDEEGPQGRARAAGPLRGPRPEVRRPGRRPRPCRPWSRRCAQAKRFGGPVIVHAITRKGFGYDAAERHEADQFHSPGPVRRRDRRGDRPRAGSGPTSSPTRWCTSARERQDVVGDHRRDDAPGRAAHVPGPVPRADLRRRHRRAARRHLAPPAWRWAGCTRSWRSTRRSSTAPSTRC